MLGLCALLIAVAPAWGQQFCPWSVPVNLGSVVNSANGDFLPFISKDGLSLYFVSNRSYRPGDASFNIWVSQWNSINNSWGAPKPLGDTINTEDGVLHYGELGMSISPDGHTMYFASTQPGGFGPPLTTDISFSRRHNKRDDFGWLDPVNLGNGVNTAFNEANPEIFEDDSTGVITLYFDSNRPGGPGPFDNDASHSGNDIYTSILQRNGTFGPATLVDQLSTPFVDRTVSIRRDGLEIFFASDRPGGFGLLDLWTSTRASTSDPWSTPVTLGSTVNSGSRDGGPSLSFDGTTLYFQSDRAGGIGGSILDLYVTTREKMHGPGSCQ